MKVYRFSFEKEKEILEVAQMFAELCVFIFGDFASDDAGEYVKEVLKWKTEPVFIVKTDAGEIAGFAMCEWVKSGFVKKHLYGSHLYVKKEYRNTKAAYLLYHVVVDLADATGNALLAKASFKADSIVKKLATKQIFTEYMRYKNG